MSNREIAQKLGISPAALSLIINNKPGVSDATRERVKQQLFEMGYPDLIKKKEQIPANPKSQNIVFIIYKKTGKILDLHPFFMLILESIEKDAAAVGYGVLLNTIDCRSALEPQFERLRELGAAGGIIFSTEMEWDDMDRFKSLPFPVVAMDNEFPRLQCDAVAINNTMGTWQALHYLAEAGYRRIGYLKSTTRIASFRERERGYLDAADELGLEIRREDIIETDYTEDGSFRDLDIYLNENPDLPQAFVCDDDTIASGALRAFAAHEIRVPEDISIVGFNDRPNCAVTKPPLTTVCVSRHGLAKESMNLLADLIREQRTGETQSKSRKIRIGTTLSVRESVKNRIVKL